MVIGSGLIAQSLKKYVINNKVLVFASGVSNSNESSFLEFKKEKELLKEKISQFSDMKLIYFSSCSLEDLELKNTPYHLHKLEMEKIIKKYVNKYIIFRIPNLLGSNKNPYTLINFIYNKIKEETEFLVWSKATRNVVDIDDFTRIIYHIVDNNYFTNEVVNIAYPDNYEIGVIIDAIEKTLGKKGKYSFIDKGSDIKINIDKILPVLNELQIEQPSVYDIIKKHKGL